MTVCMLLGKSTQVWQLLNELQALIDFHAIKFQGAEAKEWRLVIAAITAFVQVRPPHAGWLVTFALSYSMQTGHVGSGL